MTPALQVSGVSKRYGSLQALDGVSLSIEPGEFFALLGPNGAGKTTLIGLVAGLARADAGSVRVMGHDVQTDFRAARRALGVVPQELVFDPFFSVRETLRLQSGYFGLRGNDDWIDELLVELDLAGKADANMRQLSGGMKRRVLVAQALVHRPPVIVLDEPTAGVDVELRQTLWKFVRRLNREGHAIVLTTHYLEEAEQLCTRVAMMRQGRVVLQERMHDLMRRFAGGRMALRASGAPLPESLRSLLLAGPDPLPDGGWSASLKVESHSAVEPVLATLREAGCQLDELQLQHTDLEDVFVQVMQQQAAGMRA